MKHLFNSAHQSGGLAKKFSQEIVSCPFHTVKPLPGAIGTINHLCRRE
jgi:hypothetical protein